MTFVWLAGHEPAEITWTDDEIEVVMAVDREWWDEKLGRRVRTYGGWRREV